MSKPGARWVTVVLLLGGTYEIAVNTAGFLGWTLPLRDPRLAAAYVLAAVAIATLSVRPWRTIRRDLVPLTTIAAFLVGANAYRAGARWWADAPPAWLPTVDALSFDPVRNQNTNKAPARDIYYIVLDAMGRADTLQELYGLDLGPFVADLKSRGFQVVSHARSNYAHTQLSFSSFLNLAYLDPVANAVGKTSESQEALDFLIQHNALMRLAKQAGYQVVGIGTDYPATSKFDEADICVCQQYGLSLFEQAVIGATPLAAAPLDRWTYSAHRRKTLASLDTLETGIPSPQRQFVFAHILAPHPPFLFTPDGGYRRPDRPFSITDGSEFQGSKEEYVQGYRDQAAFIVQRVERVVHAILSRPGPQPVIVIHGDHGPGSRLQSNDPTHTDMTERMAIFEAYYFPEGGDALSDSISPVNLSRALANRYFGTTLGRLPEASFFSTPRQPYDFIPVSPQSAGGS